jgi:putative transposase
VLIDQIAARLKTILREVAAEHQARVLELELTPALACGASVPDHVHLLCEVDPQYGIHRLVRQMKGRSSRLLRQEFPTLRSRLPTLWTNSYFVSSFGSAPLAVIKQYIEDQKNV